MAESAYKQVTGYIDRLHADIGKLIILVERLMEENGFVAFPSAGNRASWGISSHYAYPDRWRIPNISRFYAPEGTLTSEEEFKTSLLYFITLETDTVFPFPAMLCARIAHPPLPEKELYSKVWHIDRLLSLAQEEPRWRAIREENGWYVAEPADDAPIHRLQGYFLNVFDLVDRWHVIDNVVMPLTTAGAHLDELLTVPSYGFGPYKEETV